MVLIVYLDDMLVTCLTPRPHEAEQGDQAAHSVVGHDGSEMSDSFSTHSGSMHLRFSSVGRGEGG